MLGAAVIFIWIILVNLFFLKKLLATKQINPNVTHHETVNEDFKQEINALEAKASKASSQRDTLAIILEGVEDGVFALDINKRFVMFNKSDQKIWIFKKRF